jgi:hypothetical protein
VEACLLPEPLLQEPPQPHQCIRLQGTIMCCGGGSDHNLPATNMSAKMSMWAFALCMS